MVSTRRRRAVSLMGAVLAAVVAACGSNPPGPTPPTVTNPRQAYVVAADSICRAGQAKLAALGDRPETLAALPGWIGASTKQTKTDVVALRALTPAASDAGAVTAMLQDLDDGIAQAPAVGAAGRAGSPTAVDTAWATMVHHYSNAGAAARSIGFVVCGQGVPNAGGPGTRGTVVVTANAVLTR